VYDALNVCELNLLLQDARAVPAIGKLTISHAAGDSTKNDS
jgi:hypothetical protein